jgi:hypothetical protein
LFNKKNQKSVVKIHQIIGLSIDNEKEIGKKLNKNGGKNDGKRSINQHERKNHSKTGQR